MTRAQSGPAARLGWRERWLNWRNRLVASRGFQRWAARSLITRPIARSQARQLFDLTAGFVYSQILSACLRAQLFERLMGGPLELDEIARLIALPADGASRLVQAAAALGLLQALGDGRYALGLLGAGLLGNPGVAAMIAHHDVLYGDLADPLALLRDERPGRLANFWDYSGASTAPYSALMTASQPLVADTVLDSYPFQRHQVLLDIGGGEGGFLAAAGRRYPGLSLRLFDLEPVASRAEAALSPFAARVQIFAGDFTKEPLPADADLMTLVRVLHDHDDAAAMAILRAARNAVGEPAPPGKPPKTLLVAEPMSDAPGAQKMGAYFGFYFAAMGRGRPRSAGEISEMLRESGFRAVRRLASPIPLLAQVIRARV